MLHNARSNFIVEGHSGLMQSIGRIFEERAFGFNNSKIELQQTLAKLLISQIPLQIALVLHQLLDILTQRDKIQLEPCFVNCIIGHKFLICPEGISSMPNITNVNALTY
jgi:hypothetical protein